MQTTIIPAGDFCVIPLPEPILEAAQFEENDIVQVTVEYNKIVIQKASKRHQTLEERFEGYSGDYKCEEWDTGPAVGREIIKDDYSK